MSRGRFITLEGGEGAGKSTQARRIGDWLAHARGREVVLTREPGGSPLAEGIRALVLSDWAEGVGPEAELLLMFAARAAHLRATILPALEAGRDVICDRFVDSSYAYQGAGKGIAARHVAGLERLVLKHLQPDLTLVLDLPPELGLARTQARREQNRFEGESLDFMQRVRAEFLDRARRSLKRYVVIDASQEVDIVWAHIQAVLEQRL